MFNKSNHSPRFELNQVHLEMETEENQEEDYLLLVSQNGLLTILARLVGFPQLGVVVDTLG